MKMIFTAIVLFLSVSLYAQTGKPNSELATGYVHVKQIDGIWWFISPEGEKFISMGVNHVEPHLWLAPYNKETTLERYGSDMVNEKGYFNTDGKAAKKWIDQQLETTKDLNFNTWGRHTHPDIKGSLYNNEIYYLAALQTGPLAGWRERNGEGPRPDVFSVDFYNFLNDRVETVCAEHRNNPNCLGYLYTDVPS